MCEEYINIPGPLVCGALAHPVGIEARVSLLKVYVPELGALGIVPVLVPPLKSNA